MDQWIVQLILSVLTIVGSLVVARATAKHQMKKELFELRYEVYKKLLRFLLRLERDPRYRRNDESPVDLLDHEVDIRMCGTKNLDSLVVSLRTELDKSLCLYNKLAEYDRTQFDNEAELKAEKEQISYDEAVRILQSETETDFEQSQDGSLSNEKITKLTDDIVQEMRRSLGYREARPLVWFRSTCLFRKLRFWV